MQGACGCAEGQSEGLESGQPACSCVLGLLLSG